MRPSYLYNWNSYTIGQHLIFNCLHCLFIWKYCMNYVRWTMTVWSWISPAKLMQYLDCWEPGPWFNIKMLSYQYRKSHCGDKTVVRLSYLHNRISYTGKMTFLYWFGPRLHVPPADQQPWYWLKEMRMFLLWDRILTAYDISMSMKDIKCFPNKNAVCLGFIFSLLNWDIPPEVPDPL